MQVADGKAFNRVDPTSLKVAPLVHFGLRYNEIFRLLLATECVQTHSLEVQRELPAIISHWMQSPDSEILRYLAVDCELTSDKTKWDWQAAMDAQILQKILPKLHGSKRKVGALLNALSKYCETGDLSAAEKLLSEGTGAEFNNGAEDAPNVNARFMASHSKLREMIEILNRDQFVSFIQ